MSEKKVLIAGLGKSGISAAKLLAGECGVTVWDSKKAEEFPAEELAQLASLGVSLVFGDAPDPAGFDELLMSPGVPTDIELVKKAKSLGIRITGELECAYEHCRGRFVAITGTNGKTTTTTLTGEIFKAWGADTRVVGNIGVPVTSCVSDAGEDTYMVTEVSSFQLETTSAFRPRISAILNLTPDHLNRHGSFEEYVRCKALVFANQGPEDYFVYNEDDPLCAKLAAECRGPVCVPFSRKNKKPFEITEISIPGAHNMENALAAAAVCLCAGIPEEIIRKTIAEFQGVEHRMEFVRELDGVRYVNDSKGTNPDSSIKAIEATDTPILLIAGGYEKNSDFTELIECFGGKVKKLLLLGVTARRFADCALRCGFPAEDIVFCRDMDECVAKGRDLASPGDTVLLSPASASWDMYSCFEERGDHFRKLVHEL